MLSGIIAYQVLQQENPQTIEKVKAVLPSRGSFTWLATYTSPYTRHSYSPLNIPKATGEGMKSVCG
jgi:hypothetical protein